MAARIIASIYIYIPKRAHVIIVKLRYLAEPGRSTIAISTPWKRRKITDNVSDTVLPSLPPPYEPITIINTLYWRPGSRGIVFRPPNLVSTLFRPRFPVTCRDPPLEYLHVRRAFG